MSRRLILAIVLHAFVCLGTARAEEKADTIKVVSYNVQFLPGPGRIANKRPNQFITYRAERLGQEMSKFDIAGLQETFDDAPREVLLGQLKTIWGDRYNAAIHPKPEDRFNGGLAIVAPRPILEWHHSYYTAYSTPKEYGVAADGHAAKGMLHARIARSKDAPAGDFIDAFDTHLEARADKFRPQQYKEMAAFIKEHADPKHPSILFGDMNTHAPMPGDAEIPEGYALMIAELKAARPDCELLDVWRTLYPDSRGGTGEQETTEKGNRIDYVFIFNPPAPNPRLRPVEVKVNGYLDPKTVALSDHSAVEAEIEWPKP